jgi:hypothetical protein
MIRIAGTELEADLLVIKGDRLIGRFRSDRAPDRESWERIFERLGPDTRFSGREPLRFERRLTGDSPEERIREVRNILLTEDEAEYVTRFTTTMDALNKNSQHAR